MRSQVFNRKNYKVLDITLKDYIKKALASDKADDICRGWDFMGNNITKDLLDICFQVKYWELTYNSEKEDYILKQVKETLTEEEKRTLGSFVYIMNNVKKAEEKEEYKKKMLLEGFVELTENVVKEAFANKKRLIVNASKSCNWMSWKVNNEIYKPFISDKGDCYLQKLRQRTRAFYLHSFQNAYCKLVEA